MKNKIFYIKKKWEMYLICCTKMRFLTKGKSSLTVCEENDQVNNKCLVIYVNFII